MTCLIWSFVLRNMTCRGLCDFFWQVLRSWSWSRLLLVYRSVWTSCTQSACCSFGMLLLHWITLFVMIARLRAIIRQKSFYIHVLYIWLPLFLPHRKARRNVKPKEEDRTYMSLSHRDRSPEYDVIAQTPNWNCKLPHQLTLLKNVFFILTQTFILCHSALSCNALSCHLVI